jgi:hypothetical protein
MSTELEVMGGGAVTRTSEQQDVLDLAQSLIQTGKIPAESIPALLNQMFDFKLKVRAVSAAESFNRDFMAAKREMPVVPKNGKVDMKEKGSYDFAKYDDVQAIISPIEEKYGFARSFESVPSKGVVHMLLVMRHRDGHVERSSAVELPPDEGFGRNGMQARRSSSSYAKRGLTLDYWDILTKGADNDAKTAEPITPEQADQIRDILTESGSSPNDQRFLKWLKKNYNVDSIGRIQRQQFADIFSALEERRRNQQ